MAPFEGTTLRPLSDVVCSRRVPRCRRNRAHPPRVPRPARNLASGRTAR